MHAAGIASPYYYRAYPLETLGVAIDGTKNMLDLAELNSAKLTFFSSSEIYGDPDMKNIPTKESYKGNVYHVLAQEPAMTKVKSRRNFM